MRRFYILSIVWFASVFLFNVWRGEWGLALYTLPTLGFVFLAGLESSR